MKIIKKSKPIFLLLIFCVQLVQSQDFLKGADLSYANELQDEDCNIKFKKKAEDSESTDVYKIFGDYGCNIVRARLWVGDKNIPSGEYSTIADVKKTFENARANIPGVKTLLTIHYSDNWADPAHQRLPQGWLGLFNKEDPSKPDKLIKKVTEYTTAVIAGITKELIDYISIGNETNPGILCPKDVGVDGKNNKDRCAAMGQNTSFVRMQQLLQAGINAARTNGFAVNNVMVHIAGPTTADWWLKKMKVGKGGLNNFGLIGLSYYPALPINERKGHDISIKNVGSIMMNIIAKYKIRPLIVETSHPYTKIGTEYDKINRMNFSSSYENFTNINNPTPGNQKTFLTRLTNTVYDAGGLGVIYWEPAWVSPAKENNKCIDRPKKNDDDTRNFGSDQEHHTFFRKNHAVETNGGISFMNLKKDLKVKGLKEVTFNLTIENNPDGKAPYLAVNFDSSKEKQKETFNDVYWNDEKIVMEKTTKPNVWTAKVKLKENTKYVYKYMNGKNPSDSEKLTGDKCTDGQTLRKIVVWRLDVKEQIKNDTFAKCTN